MRRRKCPRVTLAVTCSCALATLAGCKPDIPLIPFIKADTMPYATAVELEAEFTPPGHCPQASQARPRTAP
jgi:hypothetical protein